MRIIEQFNYETEGNNFIKRELRVKTKEIGIYRVILLMFSLLAIAYVIKHFLQSDIEGIFVNIFIGTVAYFIIVPIHELLHGLAYVIIGAKSNLKIGIGKGLIYCLCPDFEMSKNQYILAALLPVISVTCISIVFAFVFLPYVLGIILFDLLHIWSSNGDIAIFCFLSKHKKLHAVSHEHNKMLIFFEK